MIFSPTNDTLGEASAGEDARCRASWDRRKQRPGAMLKAAGIRPSKTRGQNFLVQPIVATQIVSAAAIEPVDAIVEIGPGLGMLTERIMDAEPRRLTLIEVDPRLAAMLAARFGADKRVSIIARDFLSVRFSEFGNGRLKVIGNLPFSAAAAILRHLCEYRESIARMVLMFQREVGARIRAQPGARNYGSLSVFSLLYWRTLGHFPVAGGSFFPRPKVDAEVLIMEPRRQLDFDKVEEADIRATVRAVFSAPRKTIRNSLAGSLGINTDMAKDALAMASIEPSSRPATVDCSQLIALARILRPATSPAYRA
ncbi:MAG: ribosomal RNA small subunit methyltransferase A [Deltaproteobacteria bacterium]|nr:ribosomal RNA small subunit methyltransferase A [Deltaproteobacteria bacterium]